MGRIFDIFRDTPYAFPRKWRLIFWTVMMIITLFTVALNITVYGNTDFVLESVDSHHVYCAAVGNPKMSDEMEKMLMLLMVGLTCIGGTFFSIIFMCIFNNRLARIQGKMLTEYMEENMDIEPVPMRPVPIVLTNSLRPVPLDNVASDSVTSDGLSPPTPTLSTPASPRSTLPAPSPDCSDIGTPSTPTEEVPRSRTPVMVTTPSGAHRRRKLTIEDLDSEVSKRLNQSAQRIKELNDVIKKQDILAGSMAITVMTYFILLIYDHTIFWFLITPCILSFHLCLWLEFKTSAATWNCCKRYGCCVLCYYKKKKDVAERMCC